MKILKVLFCAKKVKESVCKGISNTSKDISNANMRGIDKKLLEEISNEDDTKD